MVERLNQALDRKLSLISAQSGAGKTTLLSPCLWEGPEPKARLSVDEHDIAPIVFLGYLCRAIRTGFPNNCGKRLVK
ncbi:MAG: hypothetical protein WA996_02790 [Candidatus Promineifilaceae bacterium]